MSASNSGPGGVRNLAAMFENKAGEHPSASPIRGRSPNGSVSSSQERPADRVRASFVAVDKPGEGVQGQSTSRKPSDVIMEDTNEHEGTDTQGLGEILKGSPFIDDGKFEAPPAQNSKSNGVADRAAAMVKKMQQGNTEPPAIGHVELSGQPKKLPRGHGPPVHASKAPPELPSAQKDDKKPDVPTRGPVVKPKGGVEKIKGVMASAADAEKEREAALNGDKQNEDASKISNSTESANKPKSIPLTLAHGVRPKGGVSKIQGIMESAKQAREARAAAAAKSLPQSDGSKDTKPPTASKPRSSLPARKPPYAATALTASSVAKNEESKSAEKKISKVPPRVANVTTASQLAKKSSRASLNSNDGAKSRPSVRPADEGFLARMMRPTASSAQKSHDKVQVSSPPRPKQNTSKALTSRPSRRSLSQTSENKENETDVPAEPTISSESEDRIEQTDS